MQNTVTLDRVITSSRRRRLYSSSVYGWKQWRLYGTVWQTWCFRWLNCQSAWQRKTSFVCTQAVQQPKHSVLAILYICDSSTGTVDTKQHILLEHNVSDTCKW